MPEARILDGRRVAQEIRGEVKVEAEQLFTSTGVRPRIVFLLVGNNPASQLYVRSKGTDSEESGFSHETIVLEESISEAELLKQIDRLNADPATHGILVQLPLPKHIREELVIEAIDPRKDVDGFHPLNVGRLSIGKGEYFAPCTPAGVVELLAREGVDVSGKHAVIVGRSNIVGKPLGLLLVQKTSRTNALVTIAHTAAGEKLKDYTRSADILIAAIGVPRAITADMVSEGTVVVDVGINRIEDPATKSGYRTVGDVDFANVSKIASAITPVPFGIGPMTRAMLLKNTLTAAKRFAGVK